MKPLKNFKEYIKRGIIKKHSLDKSRAMSLIEDSERDRDFLTDISKKIGINDEGANTIIKGSYDVLMGLIRAKLLLQGFKETEVQFADQLRWSRNGILYYGRKFDKEYAEKVLVFLNKNYPKLKKTLGENQQT